MVHNIHLSEIIMRHYLSVQNSDFDQRLADTYTNYYLADTVGHISGQCHGHTLYRKILVPT